MEGLPQRFLTQGTDLPASGAQHLHLSPSLHRQPQSLTGALQQARFSRGLFKLLLPLKEAISVSRFSLCPQPHSPEEVCRISNGLGHGLHEKGYLWGRKKKQNHNPAANNPPPAFPNLGPCTGQDIHHRQMSPDRYKRPSWSESHTN